jgi:26S proteasome regulatory subunit N3
MDVDTAAPTAQVSIKHGLPEIEIYCYLLVLIFLIDNKKYDEVCLGFLSTLLFVGNILI